MNVLVVEDNRDILANIVDYLQLKGFGVDSAEDGQLALEMALANAYDIIVLDIMLPGLDGYEFCRHLREQAQLETPIIMLTARDALEDKLRGLNMGADDYLVKPFALSELVARMERVVKRTRGTEKKLLKVADLSYDLDTLEVTRAGTLLKLNPIGLKLLAVLMQRSPAIVKRDFLENLLWGKDAPESDSLRTHIHILRQTIDKPFDKPLLRTIHGVGYCVADTAGEV